MQLLLQEIPHADDLLKNFSIVKAFDWCAFEVLWLFGFTPGQDPRGIPSTTTTETTTSAAVLV